LNVSSWILRLLSIVFWPRTRMAGRENCEKAVTRAEEGKKSISRRKIRTIKRLRRSPRRYASNRRVLLLLLLRLLRLLRLQLNQGFTRVIRRSGDDEAVVKNPRFPYENSPPVARGHASSPVQRALLSQIALSPSYRQKKMRYLTPREAISKTPRHLLLRVGVPHRLPVVPSGVRRYRRRLRLTSCRRCRERAIQPARATCVCARPTGSKQQPLLSSMTIDVLEVSPPN